MDSSLLTQVQGHGDSVPYLTATYFKVHGDSVQYQLLCLVSNENSACSLVEDVVVVGSVTVSQVEVVVMVVETQVAVENSANVITVVDIITLLIAIGRSMRNQSAFLL